MSFLEHLEELRWRLIKGMIGVVIGVIGAFIFSDFIIDTLLLGPTRATFFMYDIIRVDAIDLTLQSRKLPDSFSPIGVCYLFLDSSLVRRCFSIKYGLLLRLL